MKNKKKLIILFTIIGIILIMFILRNSWLYIRTSTSGGLIGSSSDSTYLVNSILKIKLYFPIDNYEDKEKNYEQELYQALAQVKLIDNEVFEGRYNTINELVFKADNYIFYYRENDMENIYRYNTLTNTIEKFKFSDNIKSFENDDLGNFAVINSIRAEAILNLYPDLFDKINQIKGMFYGKLFYNNNRIFFEKNNTIYEYNVKNGKVLMVTKIEKDVNVKNIYVK